MNTDLQLRLVSTESNRPPDDTAEGEILSGKVIPLTGTVTIGRATSNSVRPNTTQVSRNHVTIDCTGDGCKVSDLGSRNGTFVNEAQISEETSLAEGDQLKLSWIVFRVERAGEAEQIPADATGTVVMDSPPSSIASDSSESE